MIPSPCLFLSLAPSVPPHASLFTNLLVFTTNLLWQFVYYFSHSLAIFLMHEKTLQTRRLNPTQNHLNSVFHFEEASITLCFFLYESHTPLHLPTSLSVSRSLRIPFEHTEFVCILLEFVRQCLSF